MNVLICASEGAPYIKTGGLADVIGALPKALKKEGIDVRVIMPYYKKIKEKNQAEYIGYAYVRIADHNEYLGLFKAENEGVIYYFIDSDKYFNRDTIYGHGDDGERFAFFCFAVLEAIKVANFYPDIIHNNDWQTGLIPYILKANYNYYPEYRRIKTVYSIHNIQYQGIFPKNLLDILFMPYSNSLEFNNCVNFMKTAIMESDIINTVSPTYKDEVLTDYYGYEMNKVLELRKYDFYGIINGLDVDKYNPATDKNLYQNYDSNSFIEGKRENKRQLLTEYHANSLEAPLFGLVSRLVDQKGVDLFMPILEDVLYYSNATFFILGSGDKKYEDYFNYLAAKYPGRFLVYIGYSDPLAQKIYAASDVFLMPSKFEPCGLGQMIAMRYGTLPLVRETGGLKDTVIPYNQYTGEGTGFSFANYNAHNFKDVIFLAMSTYENKEAWNALVKRAMEQDFSWNSSAKSYIELYNKLL